MLSHEHLGSFLTVSTNMLATSLLSGIDQSKKSRSLVGGKRNKNVVWGGG